MINLEKGVLNIHRLVQQVIRLKFRDQRKEETLRRAITVIKRPLEESNTYSWKCLTHAISTWNHARNDDNRISTEELIVFSCWINNKLIIYERYQEANAFVTLILEFLKSKTGIGHLSVLHDEHNTASVLVINRDNISRDS